MAGPTRTLIVLALAALTVGCSRAESAPDVGSKETAAKAAQRPVAFVPSGSTLIFAMDEEISTKSAKSGDAFSAHLVSPYTDAKGAILLPAGAILHGTVAESMESPSNDEPAVIRLEVGTVETAGGTLLLNGEVKELQVNTDAKDTNTLTAVKVAAGAAAGAIIGKITGKTKTGAAVGTAGGVALALATREGNATVPIGSHLVVRLTERLSLR